MSSLIRIPEIDMNILLQLEDYELSQICQVNSYVDSLCNDPTFWYKKIIEKIDKSIYIYFFIQIIQIFFYSNYSDIYLFIIQIYIQHYSNIYLFIIQIYIYSRLFKYIFIQDYSPLSDK